MQEKIKMNEELKKLISNIALETTECYKKSMIHNLQIYMNKSGNDSLHDNELINLSCISLGSINFYCLKLLKEFFQEKKKMDDTEFERIIQFFITLIKKNLQDKDLWK
jgi:hypothetical protein